MRTIIRTATLAGLLFISAAIYGQAASDYQQLKPCETVAVSSEARPGMMPCGKPCMMAGAPSPGPCVAEGPMRARHNRRDRWHGMDQGDCEWMGMSQGKRGKRHEGIEHRMGRMLFLDRVEALQLTPDQVYRLKAIHADCRRENIRQGAEVKIARLELKDLLDETSWIPAAAEKLIRKIKTLEGDMQVRHLRAVAEARKILTAEQLRKADAGRDGDEAEDLFK